MVIRYCFIWSYRAFGGVPKKAGSVAGLNIHCSVVNHEQTSFSGLAQATVSSQYCPHFNCL
jgi:hypothetical protein